MAKNQQPDADTLYRSFTLWFQTLPNGDTAQVYLWPHPNDVDVISHWNGQMCRTETCADLEEAQRRGWEWHKALVHGPQPKLAPRHPAADLRLFRSPLLR
jgi:hypothetical protein